VVDHFGRHKKYILRNRKIAVFTLIIGLIFLVLFLWASFKNPNTIWITLFPLAVIVIATICIATTNRLLNQFSKIQTSQISEIKISHPKIDFLTTPELTPVAHHVRQKYYGIKIIGEQKFYYLFGECYKYTAEDLKKIYTKFNDEISIQYYEGTTIIKTIQNDPYFMKFKVGSLYE
jgi:hypothetical protein